MASTFKTADGYCHILQEYMLLSKSENPETGNVNKQSTTGIWGSIFWSVLITICIAGGIIGLLTDELYYGLIMFVFAGLFILIHLQKSLYYQTNIIQKSSILKIEFKEPVYGAQRPHFIIHFMNDKNKKQKQIIVLGNEYTKKDNAELQNALTIIETAFG